MGIRIFALICGIIAVTVPLVFLWRVIGWQKGIAVILGICMLDVDHFMLTNQPGFLQVPEQGEKILHVFHTIEFLLVVVALNMLERRRGRSWRNWLFPQHEDYESPWRYSLVWAVRILLFSIAIHYFMDVFFYTILGKWSHYEVSLIYYF